MLALASVTATISAKLAAASYLSGLTIVNDTGTAADEKSAADALDAKGVAITILPPRAKASVPTNNSGLAEIDIEIPVFFELNPERNATATNPGGANKEMLALVTAGIQAVLSYRSASSNPQDLFSLSDQAPLELDAFQAGLYCYLVTFQKRCAI